MPTRKVILATNEVYHIFNRSTHNIPIFKDKRSIDRFLKTMTYYLQNEPPVRFSFVIKEQDLHKINPDNFLVKIIAYCLMPTHFHFLVRQEKERGIQKYFQRLTNSYSHYFNLKNKQKGPLFESPFKAIRVETNEQLLHLSRYIHLNPVSDFLIENPEDFPYSSCRDYTNTSCPVWLDPNLVLEQFASKDNYREFILARKDYQRELTRIKHLLLE